MKYSCGGCVEHKREPVLYRGWAIWPVGRGLVPWFTCCACWGLPQLSCFAVLTAPAVCSPKWPSITDKAYKNHTSSDDRMLIAIALFVPVLGPLLPMQYRASTQWISRAGRWWSWEQSGQQVGWSIHTTVSPPPPSHTQITYHYSHPPANNGFNGLTTITTI